VIFNLTSRRFSNYNEKHLVTTLSREFVDFANSDKNLSLLFGSLYICIPKSRKIPSANVLFCTDFKRDSPAD
jgi:hypothetical protein